MISQQSSKSVSSKLNLNQKIQPKFTINNPGDVYEQEADAMAEKVMRMPFESRQGGMPPCPTSIIGASIQRKCTSCEEEEKRKPIMRKEVGVFGGMPVSNSFSSSLNATKGGGSSLPKGTKSFMENAFSTNFSNVRIHNDSQANKMSQSINAKAFTHGNDIYFGAGQYNPNTHSGKSLLAHELTHTVQHVGNTLSIQRQSTDAGVPLPAGIEDSGQQSGFVVTPAIQTPPSLSPSIISPPRICGPNVTTQVESIWAQIPVDFAGLSTTNKLASSIYLISPYVPAGTNPRSDGGSEFLGGSWAEPFRSILGEIGARLGNPFLTSLISGTNRWQLNRDAFDTIGLFVLSAGWTLGLPSCGQPSCGGLSSASLPRGTSDQCEDPALCAFSVQMGTNCWLSGTVNYGTYGLMMKSSYDWCGTQRSRLLSILPGIVLSSYGNLGAVIRNLRLVMSNSEIVAAFLKELFSIQSLNIYVGGYKIWDMENPTSALSWASATYLGGPTARAPGSNRPRCNTTCTTTGSVFPNWNYVWEPVRHR